MIVRDKHVVFEPNNIEDQDPGDHDDGIPKAALAYLDEQIAAAARAPRERVTYTDEGIEQVKHAIARGRRPARFRQRVDATEKLLASAPQDTTPTPVAVAVAVAVAVDDYDDPAFIAASECDPPHACLVNNECGTHYAKAVVSNLERLADDYLPGECRRCISGLPRVWDSVLECYSHEHPTMPGSLLVCETPWVAQKETT